MICLHKFVKFCASSLSWPNLGFYVLELDFVLVDYMCVVVVVSCDICGCCVPCDHGDMLCI